ncbi:MAG TPA: PEPxxWA-CTERM sorting domain-containing protein [Phenylobacterium sp.]|nr:PEPxxWA-CTERM sorting domain-containing protein [Phenylobacterium sp.]
MMTKAVILSALAALALASPAAAATIAPVGVEASSTFTHGGSYKAENLINGSGMTGAQHDAYFGNMWMTDLSVDKASLTFDLGGLYNLSGVQIWNYNFGDDQFAVSTLDRAARAFVLSISTDGVTFTDILTDTLSRGTGALLGGESFGLSGAARFVRLNLDGNHQKFPETYGYAPIGLSEVRFEGVASAVPEPATWAMMITGFGLAGVAIRRRSAITVAA